MAFLTHCMTQGNSLNFCTLKMKGLCEQLIESISELDSENVSLSNCTSVCRFCEATK